MATAIIAGIAGAVGTAAAGISIFGLAVGLQSIAAAFAIGAGLSLVSQALMPSIDLGAAMEGRSITTREAAQSRKIVYGRARVGGNIVYLESTGTDNKYLWLVVAVAGHEIDAFEEVWFNETRIWNGSFTGTWGQYVSIGFHKGDQTTADSALNSASTKWTSSHVLRDTAYMVVKLTYDAEQFANGLPNISTRIRGKKVLNPATSVTEWSQNPALCVYDYLRDTKYGLGETASNILTSSVTAAATVCDETVALSAGGTQKRYALDGVVDTAGSIKGNLDNMLGSMIGRLVFSAGKFEIYAGEYVAPTYSVDESVAVGDISIQTKQSRRNAYNGVKGVFVSETDNYIVSDYPAQISSTFAAEDGDPIYLDMPLPFTVNNIRAQRIAKLALLRSRQQEAITIPCNLSALRFKIGDNINVTNARLGYSNKVFEVVGYAMDFTSEGQIIVNVDAIETAASIWDWTTSDEEVYLGAGEVSLYDGLSSAAPTSLTVTASNTVNEDGTVTPSLDCTWTASDDAFIESYVLEWTNTTDSGETYSQSTRLTDYSIAPVIPNKAYSVQVFAVNELGVKSAAVTSTVTSVADTTPKLPSLYQAVTDSSAQPTSTQFSTAAGRAPKNGDVFLATDTTTATDTVHAWTYNALTTSWAENTNFISGDLIVDGSITGDQITANSIQVNKLTGDVSETFPVNYPSSIGACSANGTVDNDVRLTIPAPTGSVEKNAAICLTVKLSATNSQSSGTQPVAATVDIKVERLSTGITTGTAVGGTVTQVLTLASGIKRLKIVGNHLDKLGTIGSICGNATAAYGTITPVLGYYYEESVTGYPGNFTYVFTSSSTDIVAGNSFFFNKDAWESQGTYVSSEFYETVYFQVSPQDTITKDYTIHETFGKTLSGENFRITAMQAQNVTFTSTLVTVHSVSGTMQLIT